MYLFKYYLDTFNHPTGHFCVLDVQQQPFSTVYLHHTSASRYCKLYKTVQVRSIWDSLVLFIAHETNNVLLFSYFF